MQGNIYHQNHPRGMYSVQLANGDYTVFELLDSMDLHSGDTITGDLDEVGDVRLANGSTGESFDAIIQNIHCSKTQALQRVNLAG